VPWRPGNIVNDVRAEAGLPQQAGPDDRQGGSHLRLDLDPAGQQAGALCKVGMTHRPAQHRSPVAAGQRRRSGGRQREINFLSCGLRTLHAQTGFAVIQAGGFRVRDGLRI